MGDILKFFHQHQILVTIIGGAIWNAYVGSLAAPTATSGPGYVFLFKFSNALALNFHRAAGTSIESSPNFIPAAEKYMAQQKALQDQFDAIRAHALQEQAQTTTVPAIVTAWQIPTEEKK